MSVASCQTTTKIVLQLALWEDNVSISVISKMILEHRHQLHQRNIIPFNVQRESTGSKVRFDRLNSINIEKLIISFDFEWLMACQIKLNVIRVTCGNSKALDEFDWRAIECELRWCGDSYCDYFSFVFYFSLGFHDKMDFPWNAEITVLGPRRHWLMSVHFWFLCRN